MASDVDATENKSPSSPLPDAGALPEVEREPEKSLPPPSASSSSPSLPPKDDLPECQEEETHNTPTKLDALSSAPSARTATPSPSSPCTPITTQEPVHTPVNDRSERTKRSRRSRKSLLLEAKPRRISKKKSPVDIDRDIQPGQFWLARMRGHPAWPAVICDEEILPAGLVNKRPKCAIQSDGTWHEEYAVGGKNFADRRYAIMFLGTNEFSWHPMKDLEALNLDEIKQIVEADKQGQRSKQLWEAFKVVANNPDLSFFKKMIKDHQEAVLAEIKYREEMSRMKAEKEAMREANRIKRDSVDVATPSSQSKVDTDDPSKVRKRQRETIGSGDDTVSRSKRLKNSGNKRNPAGKSKGSVNGAVNREVEVKTKNRRSKVKDSSEKGGIEGGTREDEGDGDEPNGIGVTLEDDDREKVYTAIKFLRHKLQRGFLSNNSLSTPPRHADVQILSEHLTKLEELAEADITIIKSTKIDKVIRSMLRLEELPFDEEFNFSYRCTDLVGIWNAAVAAADSENR